MARSGRHPLKERNLLLREPEQQKITITTITHIPLMEGYWKESLAVLKFFFKSLFSSTDLPFDLMVFDNASCREVTDYLTQIKQDGLIQYLVLSQQNFRKLGALDFLLRAAPGEIIAYADSDVYFLPGWLEESLEILETFPETGMVSALPTIDKQSKYLESTYTGILSNPEIKIEKGTNLIPEAFVRAHRLSLGKSKEDYTSGPQNDTHISLEGTSAFLSAQDFQFLTRKEVIQDVLPLRVKNFGEDYDPIYSPVFEQKLNKKGYWRLSTCDYLVHHMGNHVPDFSMELRGIVNRPTIIAEGEPTNVIKVKKGLARWLGNRHMTRQWLKKIYTWSYRMLFE